MTEICAKTLANLGSQPNNRTGIRLAGGIPPLVSLLFEQPSPSVRFRITHISACTTTYHVCQDSPALYP